ncbi:MULTISPECIES: TRAP transporter small permease subunit [Roseomonadaceae]|uniref:TRAP transporter small permease protein n=1 Tax=Falsiroseomonas oleicola TaxID=2801474 RepID=A0ABS6HEX7_9PROT|nr:TRAP transporter small permease [Roseomonas oleicola]MBU8546041.1 TRAP transporter small permease [Roseomonas oleicola]
MSMLLRGVDALCTAGAWLAAISAALLATILIVEVLATSFFNWSQPWAVEYAIYLQCFVLFCGAGWTLRQGGHIRVAVLMQTLPPAAARLLDMAGCVFAIGVIGFATQTLWQQLLRSFDFGSTSYYPMATPVWMPQLLLTLGFTLLLLGLVARLLRLLRREAPDLGDALASGGVE